MLGQLWSYQSKSNTFSSKHFIKLHVLMSKCFDGIGCSSFFIYIYIAVEYCLKKYPGFYLPLHSKNIFIIIMANAFFYVNVPVISTCLSFKHNQVKYFSNVILSTGKLIIINQTIYMSEMSK